MQLGYCEETAFDLVGSELWLQSSKPNQSQDKIWQM
jgi:hypothetical protein